MAHLRCDFFSEALQLATTMTVLLPEPTRTQIGTASPDRPGSPPVLYLLHGLSDDDTTWLRNTSIERYAGALGLAVVMPQVHRSFYTDQEHGGRYWTFLSEELPTLVERFFAVSGRREDTFVAGLSMGGFGAFRWALSQPERFAAAASLSGVLDLDPLWDQVFGTRSVTEAGADLFALLDAADPAALPPLHICCGTEDDFLIKGNRAFASSAAARDVPTTTDFGPGRHDWAYWDRMIVDVLDWLPLSDRTGTPAS